MLCLPFAVFPWIFHWSALILCEESAAREIVEIDLSSWEKWCLLVVEDEESFLELVACAPLRKIVFYL